MNRQLFDALLGDGEGLPWRVTIDGSLFPVYTDFRHWLRVESTIFDRRIPPEQKALFLLSTFTPAVAGGVIPMVDGVPVYPFEVDAAFAALEWFLSCGGYGDGEAKTTGRPKGKQERYYDFRHDIAFLYGGFRQAYDIDLAEYGDMHWWVFFALFTSLPEGCQMRNIISARSYSLPSKPTAEQRAQKERIALPDHIRWLDNGQSAVSDKSDVDAWAKRIAERHKKTG